MKSVGIVLRLVVLAGVFVLAAPVLAQSGHTDWGPWSFDWAVAQNTGLAIRQVRFNNVLVLQKASLPVVRVRYHWCPDPGTCGPYADRITWDNLLKPAGCGDQKVCQKSFTASDRTKVLEIGVLAAIGKYRIYQAWYLYDDGWIQARVWSKGLHHNADHDHHAYWRLDFDIDGPGADQVYLYSKGGGCNTSPGLNPINTEANSAKIGDDRHWVIRDLVTQRESGVWPGPDGVFDSFSNKDAAVRLFHSFEDGQWPFGGSGHLGYDNGESVQSSDVVFWYVAHMLHHASEGSDHWHWVGPWIRAAR